MKYLPLVRKTKTVQQDNSRLCGSANDSMCAQAFYQNVDSSEMNAPKKKKCPLLKPFVVGYYGNEDPYEHCVETCYSICPNNYNCECACGKLVGKPTETPSTCFADLTNTMAAYNGPEDRLQYCTGTCLMTCPSDTNCVANCDKILTGYVPTIPPLPVRTLPPKPYPMNCVMELGNKIANYSGSQNILDYCETECLSSCAKGTDCNSMCDSMIFGNLPPVNPGPYTPEPVYTPYPTPYPDRQPTKAPIYSNCYGSLSQEMSSYSGPQNRLDYCNSQCLSSCAVGTNCNNMCGQIVFSQLPTVGPQNMKSKYMPKRQ